MGSGVLVVDDLLLVVVLLRDEVEQMDDGCRRHPGKTRRGTELKGKTGCVTDANQYESLPPAMMSSIGDKPTGNEQDTSHFR